MLSVGQGAGTAPSGSAGYCSPDGVTPAACRRRRRLAPARIPSAALARMAAPGWRPGQHRTRLRQLAFRLLPRADNAATAFYVKLSASWMLAGASGRSRATGVPVGFSRSFSGNRRPRRACEGPAASVSLAGVQGGLVD